MCCRTREWLAAQWMRPTNRTCFLPCSSNSVWCVSMTSLTRTDHPWTSSRMSSAIGTVVAWGSRSGKKSTQKKKEEKREKSFERQEKEKKSRERHAKWKAVSEPLREGPCFLLISLIHRFLSYMAVCLTNLMVFFPLLESWMAVTPATLAIFWSQYGNGNRQP